jgi:hypothetical protein
MSVKQDTVTELHEEENPEDLTTTSEEEGTSLVKYHEFMKTFTPQHADLLNLLFANHAMRNKIHQMKGEPEETFDEFMKGFNNTNE